MADHQVVDTLCLSAQQSLTTIALARAAQARGMQVIEPYASDAVIDGSVYGYGGPRFMARLAGERGVAPLEPLDDWLPLLPNRFRRREVRLMSMSEAAAEPGRMFVKQPREKDLEAGIYSGSELQTTGWTDPAVLVSEIVSFTREYRLLVLDGQVHTGSRYLTSGSLDVRPLDGDSNAAEVVGFANTMLAELADTLPSAVTVDIGWAVHADRNDAGWAVVEANMAWFSNIYECDVDRALDVVLRAAGPANQVAARDRRFVR